MGRGTCTKGPRAIKAVALLAPNRRHPSDQAPLRCERPGGAPQPATGTIATWTSGLYLFDRTGRRIDAKPDHAPEDDVAARPFLPCWTKSRRHRPGSIRLLHRTAMLSEALGKRDRVRRHHFQRADGGGCERCNGAAGNPGSVYRDHLSCALRERSAGGQQEKKAMQRQSDASPPPELDTQIPIFYFS